MDLHLVGGAHADEGELVITGPQLAVGYWNDPVGTERAFRAIETAGEAQRAFFTRDWAERRGGRLFFKERLDFQVKIRGYRLDLGEVATAIRACGWPVVCVVMHNGALAAVVERRNDMRFDEDALRNRLGALLEEYAIPTTIREISIIPRSENDKLDRGAVLRWLASIEGVSGNPDTGLSGQTAGFHGT